MWRREKGKPYAHRCLLLWRKPPPGYPPHRPGGGVLNPQPPQLRRKHAAPFDPGPVQPGLTIRVLPPRLPTGRQPPPDHLANGIRQPTCRRSHPGRSYRETEGRGMRSQPSRRTTKLIAGVMCLTAEVGPACAVSLFQSSAVGKTTVKLVPSPSREFTQIRPLWLSTIDLTMERPSPVPGVSSGILLARKNLSNRYG